MVIWLKAFFTAWDATDVSVGCTSTAPCSSSSSLCCLMDRGKHGSLQTGFGLLLPQASDVTMGKSCSSASSQVLHWFLHQHQVFPQTDAASACPQAPLLPRCWAELGKRDRAEMGTAELSQAEQPGLRTRACLWPHHTFSVPSSAPCWPASKGARHVALHSGRLQPLCAPWGWAELFKLL